MKAKPRPRVEKRTRGGASKSVVGSLRSARVRAKLGSWYVGVVVRDEVVEALGALGEMSTSSLAACRFAGGSAFSRCDRAWTWAAREKTRMQSTDRPDGRREAHVAARRKGGGNRNSVRCKNFAVVGAAMYNGG